MPRILTINEALEYLNAKTAAKWTESELFESLAGAGLSMYAVAPKNSTAVIVDRPGALDLSEDNPYRPFTLRMRLPEGHELLALVPPFTVAEVWLRGEAATILPASHDQYEDERRFFEQPVTVTRDNIRVRREELDRLVAKSRKVSQETHSPESPPAGGALPPKQWAKGMKRIAWEAARQLMSDNGAITGPALWNAMALADGVKNASGTLRYLKDDGSLTLGEIEVKASTVKRDWCGQLKKLFSASA